MAGISIVTDSTANLPPELARQHHIEVIPLQVLFGKESFLDGVDLGTEEFYERLKAAPALPTTSQPSAGQFVRVYKRLLREQGTESIISLHLSRHLSGTYASAVAAREMIPEEKITVIDTYSASMGLGLLALRAAAEVAAGGEHDEVAALIGRLAPRTRLMFVVDTLEYLHKGGRIGAASRFLGSLLSLKPILALREGVVQPLERVRTKARALERLLALVKADVPVNNKLHVAVLHGRAPKEAAAMADQLYGAYICPDLIIAEVGPVIAAHTGPGVVGVSYYSEPEE
ncbi:MAG: DegV family protein, partial [Chloroflexota bacterium]